VDPPLNIVPAVGGIITYAEESDPRDILNDPLMESNASGEGPGIVGMLSKRDNRVDITPKTEVILPLLSNK
jgi:hypothetical protein